MKSSSFPALADCEPEWLERPVSVIATHISNVYHEFTRDRLPFITSLATRVAVDSWRPLDSVRAGSQRR